MPGGRVAAGDWVRITGLKGIWQVKRVLTGFNELRHSLDDPKLPSNRTLVFANRIFDDSWKRAFAAEFCSDEWVHPVSGDELARVSELLGADAALEKAFRRYNTSRKSLDLTVRLSLGNIRTDQVPYLDSECHRRLANDIPSGLTLDEVLTRLLQTGYHGNIGRRPELVELELTSPNYQVRDAEFVMRTYEAKEIRQTTNPAAVPKVAVGDWIRLPLSGVWKVSRILEGFNESRFSLDDATEIFKGQLAFVNRLVGDTGKRLFTTEVWNTYWATPLSQSEKSAIEDLLTSDAGLREAFERYEANPKPVDLVVNLSVGGLSRKDVEQFKSACDRLLADSIGQGLILDDVSRLLKEAGYHDRLGKSPRSAALQLVCRNHELQDGEFVLREYRVLDF